MRPEETPQRCGEGAIAGAVLMGGGGSALVSSLISTLALSEIRNQEKMRREHAQWDAGAALNICNQWSNAGWSCHSTA